MDLPDEELLSKFWLDCQRGFDCRLMSGARYAWFCPNYDTCSEIILDPVEKLFYYYDLEEKKLEIDFNQYAPHCDKELVAKFGWHQAEDLPLRRLEDDIAIVLYATGRFGEDCTGCEAVGYRRAVDLPYSYYPNDPDKPNSTRLEVIRDVPEAGWLKSIPSVELEERALQSIASVELA